MALMAPFLPGIARTGYLPGWWHAHEGVFGYGGALLAGFLLTALPNWLGRPSPATRVVLGLFGAWLAGRVAMALATITGNAAIGLADIALPLGLLLFTAREIGASGNRRTRKIAMLLALFCAAKLAFHSGQIALGETGTGTKLAVAAQVTLIMLVAGRMIPVFTQMALPTAARPIPRFGRIDAVAVGAAMAALLLWVITPNHRVTAMTLAIAAALQGLRLARWSGHLIWRQPAIAALHIAYLFIPLGLGLCAAAQVWPHAIAPSAGLHAFTAGALGTASLAIMIRMIEGQIAMPKASIPASTIIPGCAALSACLRILYASLYPEPFMLMLSGALWAFAFAAFLAIYGPLLLKPQRPGISPTG